MLARNSKVTCNAGARETRARERVKLVDVIQRRIVLEHAECVRSGDRNGESKEGNNGYHVGGISVKYVGP